MTDQEYAELERFRAARRKRLDQLRVHSQQPEVRARRQAKAKTPQAKAAGAVASKKHYQRIRALARLAIAHGLTLPPDESTS